MLPVTASSPTASMSRRVPRDWIGPARAARRPSIQVLRDRGESYERVVPISTCAGPNGESMGSLPDDLHVNLIARVRGHSPGLHPPRRPTGLAPTDDGAPCAILACAGWPSGWLIGGEETSGVRAARRRRRDAKPGTEGIDGIFYEPRPSPVAIAAVSVANYPEAGRGIGVPARGDSAVARDQRGVSSTR